MKLKTSITILGGCLAIFVFIMLPIVLSVQGKKDDSVASYTGSSFILKDVNSNPITEKSFQGPATALFFGFTHCPDVCPMTLNKLNIISEQLKEDKNKLKIFFISIDPERDTPEVMRDYLSSFGNKFIGITGDPEKIFLLSKSWGIIKEKIFTEDGNYTLNHSSPIILLKNGKYIATIRQQDDIKRSLKKIKQFL
ncbi:SCO family protein [Candidatus Pelagibacter sp.]|nr:SCO family protein [Candidatus Pelagibacter sp.]